MIRRSRCGANRVTSDEVGRCVRMSRLPITSGIKVVRGRAWSVDEHPFGGDLERAKRAGAVQGVGPWGVGPMGPHYA